MEPKILIIDDEVAIRELLSLILTDEGYHVAELSEVNSTDAVLNYNPDLIILDAKIPVIGGVRLSQDLKKNSQTSGIPILALSASSLSEIVEMKYDQFLPKPFDVDLLVEKIRTMLVEASSVNNVYIKACSV